MLTLPAREHASNTVGAGRDSPPPAAVARPAEPGTSAIPATQPRHGRPRPLRPPGKRHGLPDRLPQSLCAPAFPTALVPGNRAGRRADTPGWTPDSGANVKARAPPERAPEPPSSGYPHRSLAPIPVRHASVDTATQRSTALQGDTRRDREKTPRQHENSQLAGRFRSVWQVLGSNQRRLSRRFYRPLPCCSETASDLHGSLTRLVSRGRCHECPTSSGSGLCWRAGAGWRVQEPDFSAGSAMRA